MMCLIPVALTSLLIGSVLSAETFWGRCPSAPPKLEFDMEKFEGLWYIAESFDPSESCMTWNIVKGDSPNTWEIIEGKESGPFHTVGLNHATFNRGTLTQPDKNEPAKLRSYWPISGIAGDAAFTIHTTDYVSYAGVFECQNAGLFHRQSGLVLSRVEIMPVQLRQNARLFTKHIKVEYYQKVLQGNCKYDYISEDKNNTEPIGDDFGDFSGYGGDHGGDRPFHGGAGA